MKKIDKDMTMAEIVAENPVAAEKLVGAGLFCGGCPMAQFETIEQGAMVHGIDPDELIEKLNAELNSEQEP
jgi:hybrid cluster-associated redox disulfide protein